jgi:hypothetical protein
MPTTTSRRSALRGFSLAAIAAGMSAAALAAPGTDAELIRLGAEFDRLDLFTQGTDWHEAAFDAAHIRWWKTVEQAQTIPVTTPEGRRVKAVMLAAVIRDCMVDGWPAGDAALALVRDLAGSAVA